MNTCQIFFLNVISPCPQASLKVLCFLVDEAQTLAVMKHHLNNWFKMLLVLFANPLFFFFLRQDFNLLLSANMYLVLIPSFCTVWFLLKLLSPLSNLESMWTLISQVAADHLLREFFADYSPCSFSLNSLQFSVKVTWLRRYVSSGPCYFQIDCLILHSFKTDIMS